MTMSEFDTLRADFAGLRTELTALRADIDSRFSALRLDMETRFARVDGSLGRLEAKIDEKPGAGTIYQAALATFAGMFAVMVGTLVVLKTLGFLL